MLILYSRYVGKICIHFIRIIVHDSSSSFYSLWQVVTYSSSFFSCAACDEDVVTEVMPPMVPPREVSEVRGVAEGRLRPPMEVR